MSEEERIYFEERKLTLPDDLNAKPTKGRSELDDSEGEVKTWPMGEIEVDSPVGVLCRCTNIMITLFRAQSSDGSGYQCYLGLIYNLYSGLGHTNVSWPPPPAGLALSVVLRGKRNSFLGEFPLPRQNVGCGENGRLVTVRFDKVNPDLFPLAEFPQLWTLESSWLRC